MANNTQVENVEKKVAKKTTTKKEVVKEDTEKKEAKTEKIIKAFRDTLSKFDS